MLNPDQFEINNEPRNVTMNANNTPAPLANRAVLYINVSGIRGALMSIAIMFLERSLDVKAKVVCMEGLCESAPQEGKAFQMPKAIQSTVPIG